MEPEPFEAAFFACSRSRPNLIGAEAGVGSGTGLPKPKKVAAPQHCIFSRHIVSLLARTTLTVTHK